MSQDVGELIQTKLTTLKEATVLLTTWCAVKVAPMTDNRRKDSFPTHDGVTSHSAVRG